MLVLREILAKWLDEKNIVGWEIYQQEHEHFLQPSVSADISHSMGYAHRSEDIAGELGLNDDCHYAVLDDCIERCCNVRKIGPNKLHAGNPEFFVVLEAWLREDRPWLFVSGRMHAKRK